MPQVAPVGRRSQEHVQREWTQRRQFHQEPRSRPPPATGGDLEVKQLLPAIIPSGGRRGASGPATGDGTSPTTNTSNPQQTLPRQLSPLKKRNNNDDDDDGKERSGVPSGTSAGRVDSAPPLSEGEQEAAELLQQVREWRAFQRNHPRRLREQDGGLLDGGGNERSSLQVDAKEGTELVQPSANDDHDSTTIAGEPTTHDVPVVAAVPSTSTAATNVSPTTTTSSSSVSSSSSISPSNPSSPAAGSSPSSRRPNRVPTVVLETHVIRELYARREAEKKAAARLDATRPAKMVSLSISSNNNNNNNNNNDGSSGDVASLVTADDAVGAVGFDGSADAEERRRRPHHRRVRRFSDLGLRGLTLVGLPLEVLGDDVGGDEGKGDGATQLFHGMIKEYDPVLNRHRVRYDDGVEEWHDLQLLAYSTPLRNIPSPARRNVRRRGFGEGRDERGEGAAEAKHVVLPPLVRLGDKVRVLWDDVDGGQRWCEGFVERMREERVDAGGGGDEGVRGEGSGGEVGSNKGDDGEEREERGGVEETVQSGDRETPTLVVSVLVGYTDGDRRWHAFPGDFVYEKIDDDVTYK